MTSKIEKLNEEWAPIEKSLRDGDLSESLVGMFETVFYRGVEAGLKVLCQASITELLTEVLAKHQTNQAKALEAIRQPRH